MSQRVQRWPRWKIVVTTAGLALVATALLVLAVVVEPAALPEDDAGSPKVLTVPTFLVMMGVAVSMLAVLSMGWLIHRVRQDRIPVWERKKKRRRGKRKR